MKTEKKSRENSGLSKKYNAASENCIFCQLGIILEITSVIMGGLRARGTFGTL